MMPILLNTEYGVRAKRLSMTRKFLHYRSPPRADTGRLTPDRSCRLYNPAHAAREPPPVVKALGDYAMSAARR
jgi:hypothetical protein